MQTLTMQSVTLVCLALKAQKQPLALCYISHFPLPLVGCSHTVSERQNLAKPPQFSRHDCILPPQPYFT